MTDRKTSSSVRMRLFWSSRSPFVRKVMVTAHETGVAHLIDCKRVVVASANLNAEVMAVNPLNKIPTLILETGEAFLDSRVICEYLDSLHDGARLFPANGERRWRALRGQALGDGLMENILLRLIERSRPAELRSEPHDKAYKAKIDRTLDYLEQNFDEFLGSEFSIAGIAVGCAIAHLNFRYRADPWQPARPKLARWYDKFADRASVKATEYEEVY
jgi:glutathione S-transferase